MLFLQTCLCFAPLLFHPNQGTVHLSVQRSGFTQTIGFNPKLLALSKHRPRAFRVLPKHLATPLFGEIALGPSHHRFGLIVNGDRLYFDTNGDGNFTNDPATIWRQSPYQEGAETLQEFTGTAQVLLRNLGSRSVALNLYRFDPRDKQRAFAKDKLVYYADWGFVGTALFGSKALPNKIGDSNTKGLLTTAHTKQENPVTLYVDKDRDGKYLPGVEEFDSAKPFNLFGTTYEFRAPQNNWKLAKIVPSRSHVAEVMPPPDFSPGKQALPFTARTVSGVSLRFPEDFQGKVVMLDFWATWCGPCVAEIPNVRHAYENFHSKGLEIISISLDEAAMLSKLPTFYAKNGMTWTQVADGKGRDAAIKKLYGILQIPTAFLIDGDTGKVIAGDSSLHGEKLLETIEKALNAKFPPESG